ncbi:MAG: RND transporter [Gemmataceae bacterium]
MKFHSWQGGIVASLFGVFALLVAGCGQADNKSGQAKEKDAKAKSSQVAQAKQEDKKVHDHSGWWCDEHGIPESECSMCNAKVAAEFKKKGDWCDEHDRAKSQCFICDPKLKDKYAAVYRAKYGKEPPPIEDEEKTQKDDKK